MKPRVVFFPAFRDSAPGSPSIAICHSAPCLHHPRRCHIRLNPRIPCLPRLSPRIPHYPRLGRKITHHPMLSPVIPPPIAGGPNNPPPSQAGSHAPPPLQGQPQQAELWTCSPSPPAHAAKITTGTTLLISCPWSSMYSPSLSIIRWSRQWEVLLCWITVWNRQIWPYICYIKIFTLASS